MRQKAAFINETVGFAHHFHIVPQSFGALRVRHTVRVEMRNGNGQMPETLSGEDELLCLFEVGGIAVRRVEGESEQAGSAGERRLMAVEHLVAVAG